MDKKAAQENLYVFPYHHITAYEDGHFTQSRVLSWGFEYQAYLGRIIELLKAKNIKSLVDIGCGDGRLLAEIHRALPHLQLTGSDFSERSLAFAKAFTPSITTTLSTPTQIFDAFTLIEVLEHVPPAEIPAFLEELSGTISSSGFGIITVPSAATPVHAKHYQHFTEESLRTQLSPYFEIQHLEYLSASTPGVRCMQRLLSNRFFTIEYQPFLSWWYRLYLKQHLLASKRTGRRILAIVTRKQ